jgi:cell wall-associated NlpC family hydrolase
MIPPAVWLRENHGEMDPRLTPAGPSLALSSLKGKVSSETFTDGIQATIIHPNVSIKANPAPNAANVSEMLFGEHLTVIKASDGWAWIQANLDDYVGFVPVAAYTNKSLTPTHRVSEPLTHLYGSSDMKLPALMPLPMGSQVQVKGSIDKGFVEVTNSYSGDNTSGWIYESHLSPLNTKPKNFTDVAEKFLGSPYLWGGRTMAGIDCSALVQMAAIMASIPCPRDTDMQLAAFKNDIRGDEPLKRGDVLFFHGHVVIMVDEKNIIHANGFVMKVMIEPLADLIERQKKIHSDPVIGRKRL